MPVSRRRVLLEAAIVGLLGLLTPFAIQPIMGWASMTEQSPHLLTRSMYVLGGVLYPGAFVGTLVGAVLDVAGFTTNWTYLRAVETAISTVTNCLLFGAAWAILRGLPTTSTLRRLALAIVIVWVVGMVPFFAIGSMLASY